MICTSYDYEVQNLKMWFCVKSAMVMLQESFVTGSISLHSVHLSIIFQPVR